LPLFGALVSFANSKIVSFPFKHSCCSAPRAFGGYYKLLPSFTAIITFLIASLSGELGNIDIYPTILKPKSVRELDTNFSFLIKKQQHWFCCCLFIIMIQAIFLLINYADCYY